MKFQPTLKSWTKLGVPAVAAGFIFFAGPVNSEASELGDDLIQKGQESSQVESLQELLSDKGTLNSSAVSGSFGKETKAAVTAYQEKHNLAVDGIAGPQTIGALEVLKHGSTGQPVENLQEDLSDLGLYTIEVDGIYGDKTEKAVKEFQSKSGISVDGLAGPETFGTLHAVMTEAPSSSEAAPAPKSSASTADSKEKAPVEEKAASEDTSSQDTSSQEASAAEEAAEADERQAAQEEAAAQEAAEQEAAERQAAAEQEAAQAEEAAAEEAAEQEAAQAEQAAEEAAQQEEAAEAAAAEEAAEQEAAQAAAAQEAAEEQEAAEAAAAEQEAAEQEAAEAAAAEEEAAQEVVESSSSEASSETEASGDSFTAEATAYTAFCTGCSGTTATGVDLRANPNQNVIAVDPNVIPLGSTVEVEGMGTFTAADTGGAINGNRIDIFMPERSDAVSFGRQNLEVTVID